MQEREIEERKNFSLVSYREQLGFGLHIVVVMGTLYAVGHYAGKHLSSNPAHVSTFLQAANAGLFIGAWACLVVHTQ